ncbi:MAG TPA: hypothetical protein VFI22_19205, partial [Thermomicrobiales bacterium]|nr:hypothetical protein [Thermomicrobiales bacterium]
MHERWGEPAGWPAGVLTAADRRRFARYAEALAFFDGEQWTGRARRGETRLTFNYARALIRKIAAYVFPAAVAFNVPVPEGSGIAAEAANRAERILAAAAAELDLGRLDVDLCIDGAILGDAAVKVTWDGRAERPVVAPVDPATLAVACAADDPRRPVRVTQVYALPAPMLAGLGLAADATGRLVAFPGSDWRAAGDAGEPLAPIVETWTAERWRLEAAGQVVRDEANPYGWIPYLVAPNNPRPSAFWGESDLTDLYDVCRELNARLSVLSKVLEVSGSPVAVLENVDGSEGIAVG